MQSPQKVVQFIEAPHEPDPDAIIDKETVFKRISAIPQAVANEYAYELVIHFEDWLSIRNIILASGQPETLRALAETVPESLYGRLNKIALQLVAKDPELDEVISATLNVVVPTEGARHKAAEVIKAISDLNIDHAAKSNELMAFAQNVARVADTIDVLSKGPEFNEWVCDKLSKIPEKDLDQMALIAKAFC